MNYIFLHLQNLAKIEILTSDSAATYTLSDICCFRVSCYRPSCV